MSSTTFTSGTTIESGWLNDVNTVTYTTVPANTAGIAANTTGIATLTTTLTGSGGAAYVGYLASGTGSTTRTVAAKLRESVSPQDFGAVGDGVTDDTAALQAWAASSLPKIGNAKTYKVTGQITFSSLNPTIDFGGMIIDASAGGTFPTYGSVVQVSGSLSSLPSISGALTKDAQTLTFASAHGLVSGDVFILYNPTDRSWYPSGTPAGGYVRDYYREGEYCRVFKVTNTTSVLVEDPLFSSYTAGTLSVFLMARNTVRLANLTIKPPTTTALSGLNISLATKVRLENVHVQNANWQGIYLDRCYDVEIRGSSAITGQSAVVDSYGLMVGNSQRVRIFGGSWAATRGGFDIGGLDVVCAVPSRDVLILAAEITNDPSSSFPACDLHGNLENFSAVKCRIRGGASFAGVDNEYIDCEIDSLNANAGALVVGGSDWLGGKALIQGGTLRTSALSTTNAVVRTVCNSYSKYDTHLSVVDTFDCEAGSNTIFVKTEMTSGTPNKINARVVGVNFTNSSSLTQVVRMQGTGTGGDGDYIVVDDISGAPTGAYLYIAANGFGATIKAKLMQQYAYSSIATSISASVVSINPITWKYSYGSKVPKVQGYGCDTRVVGTKPLVTCYRAINAATGVLDVGTTDATNFSAAVTVNGFLTVGLNEL